jgi:predicted thioredoxin/glutaredoxin
MLNRLLLKNKINHEYIDIELLENKKYYDLLVENNILSLPVAIIDDKIYSDYSELVKRFK